MEKLFLADKAAISLHVTLLHNLKWASFTRTQPYIRVLAW